MIPKRQMARELVVMAHLYGCEPGSNGFTPASQQMFSCQNLLLTQDLLRDTEPALAQQVCKLLQQTNQHGSYHQSIDRRQIGFYPLINELGAQSITRIIANLTAMGTLWLEQSPPQRHSARPLKQLLDEWIALGDWLVHTAAVH
ncbi:hypothetical protein [uncultured Gilvimarinus sp.]|jgi:hypothetical protein|uniref:hypothetical protein n=1 Tax=uncultured Gilvimarinus sp. TaxID=1689143 RepID=UPI0030DC4C3D